LTQVSIPSRTVILISGRGSNMRALIEQAANEYTVTDVFSDRMDAAGLVTARELGIAAHALPAVKGVARSDYDDGLAAAIDECAPQLIVLAGFMRILSAQFVTRFAGRILNIHPSLLPKFPGLHTHRRAIEAHEAEHGATVHFVTEHLDGGPRIIQARIAIAADDTEESLGKRVQKQEHRIYPMAVKWFSSGRLRFEAGQAWLDGQPLHEPVEITEIEPSRLS
jgi:phosphoribosylglycinamide formyltransferase 1